MLLFKIWLSKKYEVHIFWDEDNTEEAWFSKFRLEKHWEDPVPTYFYY